MQKINFKTMFLAVATVIGSVACTSNENSNNEKTTSNVEAGEASGKEPTLVDPKLQEQMADIFQSYLEMKESFVASDAEGVKKAAANLENKISSVDMNLLKGDAHPAWMKRMDEMKKSLQQIKESNHIARQREYFAQFNNAYYESLKESGISGTEVYYQHCPMAMNGKGANWLSNQKEIRNPYMGEKMLTCGETKATL